MFIGCLLYADDMILRCASVKGLQSMLDSWVRVANDMILLCASVKGLQSILDSWVGVANDLSLRFNLLKSACQAIGKLAKQPIEPCRSALVKLNGLIHSSI